MKDIEKILSELEEGERIQLKFCSPILGFDTDEVTVRFKEYDFKGKNVKYQQVYFIPTPALGVTREASYREISNICRLGVSGNTGFM